MGISANLRGSVAYDVSRKIVYVVRSKRGISGCGEKCEFHANSPIEYVSFGNCDQGNRVSRINMKKFGTWQAR